MIRFIKIFTVVTLLSLCLTHRGYPGWSKIKQFNYPVGCGFFFDADNGLIGLGEFDPKNFMNGFLPSGPLLIFWTSDGGKSWTQAKMPTGGTGRVTSIFMKDRLEGYASIYSNQYSLWKTIDGGKSWQDFTQGNFERSTCVYATSSALIKTIWGGNQGGRSVDDGRSFNQIFAGGNDDQSNGIDFADDRNGVVTIGPTSFSIPSVSWLTHDGGLNWTKGGNLPESWSIYAVKGTKNFFTMSEDDATNPGQSIYWSTNGGQNWNSRFVFLGGPSFTGHITGGGNTLYVQTETRTNRGLFRSDDLGITWVNVGGPSNVRDTRFAVTGCRGEVVYAFDDQGWVWKTTDGGNGAFGFTPRIASIESKKAGDSTRIPLYIDSTTDLISIDEISGNLSLNTDLLTPVGFDTVGTLSQSVLFDTLFTAANGSINFFVQYAKPLKNGIDFSTPVIYLKAYVYQTKTDTTSVELNSLNVNSNSTLRVLSVCSSSSNFFTILKECGSTSLQDFMATGLLPKLISINPNPASSSSVEIHVYLPSETNMTLDVIDENGKQVISGMSIGHLNKEEQLLNVSTAGLSNGVYSLRLRLDDGSCLSGRVVILK